MRQDGAWFSTALEPNTDMNGIINLRNAQNQVTELSKVRHTCDEFPPATWVEGGDNTDGSTPAQTRCAGMRCGAGVGAEQNWQATSHRALRKALERLIDRRQKMYQ